MRTKLYGSTEIELLAFIMCKRMTYCEFISKIQNLTGRTFLCLKKTLITKLEYKSFSCELIDEHLIKAAMSLDDQELIDMQLDEQLWHSAHDEIVVRCDSCDSIIFLTASAEISKNKKRTKATCNHKQTPQKVIDRINGTGLFFFKSWETVFEDAHSKCKVECVKCGADNSKTAYKIYNERNSCSKCGERPTYDVGTRIRQIESHGIFDVLCFPDGYQDEDSKVEVCCYKEHHISTVIVRNAAEGSGCKDCIDKDVRGKARRLDEGDIAKRIERKGHTLIRINGSFRSIKKNSCTLLCHQCGSEWSSPTIHSVLNCGAMCGCMFRDTYFFSWSTVSKRPYDPIYVYYAQFKNKEDEIDHFYKIGLSKYPNRFGKSVGPYSVSAVILDKTTVYIGYLREQQTIELFEQFRCKPEILTKGCKKGGSECFSKDVLEMFE